MNAYQDARYEKHFLKQVVFRIDFLETVSNTQIFNKSIEKAIVEHFPVKGKDQIVRFNSLNVTIDLQKMESQTLMEKVLKEYKKNFLQLVAKAN